MFSTFGWKIFVIFIFLMAQDVTAENILGKIYIGGTFYIMDQPAEGIKAQYQDPFCQLACSEGNSLLFSLCKCGGEMTTTTTEPPTTMSAPRSTTTETRTTTYEPWIPTPDPWTNMFEPSSTTTETRTTKYEPWTPTIDPWTNMFEPPSTPTETQTTKYEPWLPITDPWTTTFEPWSTTTESQTCYYSTQRPARLSSVVKRLWDPSPVGTECDYPGLVGLFREVFGKMQPMCTASLLQEDTLLINEESCYKISNVFQLYALPDTYQASSVTKSYPVTIGSGRKLDPYNHRGELYTVKLATPLTFDTGCIQPVCVPNDNIATSDIDLTDCRIVGYGETDDDANTPSQLMEVLVTVDPSTITENNLRINRVDRQTNTACFSDDAAPMICSHSVTKEWITVGISIRVGFYCSNAEFLQTKVRNLLTEAPDKVHYYGLQDFTYQNPDTFPCHKY